MSEGSNLIQNQIFAHCGNNGTQWQDFECSLLSSQLKRGGRRVNLYVTGVQSEPVTASLKDINKYILA